MTESSQDAFRRGEVAGQTEQRLTGAEDHLAKINGHIGDMVNEIKALRLDVQGLGDAALAAANTAVALATALEAAEKQRRDKTEQAWSPLARVSVAIGSIVGLVAIVTAFYQTRGK